MQRIDSDLDVGNVSRNNNTQMFGSSIDHLSSTDDGSDNIEFGEFMDAEINPNKVKHAECGTLATRLDRWRERTQ